MYVAFGGIIRRYMDTVRCADNKPFFINYHCKSLQNRIEIVSIPAVVKGGDRNTGLVRQVVAELLEVFSDALKRLPEMVVGSITEGTDDGLSRVWADEMETFAQLVHNAR